MNSAGLNIYVGLSKVIKPLFPQEKVKEYFELFYWKAQKISQKELSNNHYEYFYTTYFGLTSSFYNNKKILDIGCGPRGSLEWANMAKERIGLDPLADEYKRLNKVQQNMMYVKAKAENIPFANNYFDVITSFNSLDHVENVDDVIEQICRVLKPGGTFLLISDIHATPTICEPSAVSWNIINKFQPFLNPIISSRLEKKGSKIYSNIKRGIPFDFNNRASRYGIITARFEKPFFN